MSTTTLLGMTAAVAIAFSVAAEPAKAAPTQPVKNIVFVHAVISVNPCGCGFPTRVRTRDTQTTN